MATKKIAITPEVERLASRPYHVAIERDEDTGDFVGRVPELPGLVAGGETREEMYAMVEDAKRMWIASALHHGDPVPDPLIVHASNGEESMASIGKDRQQTQKSKPIAVRKVSIAHSIGSIDISIPPSKAFSFSASPTMTITAVSAEQSHIDVQESRVSVSTH